MVNYLYDLDDIEKNHEAYRGRPHRRRRRRGAAPAAPAARAGADFELISIFPYTGTMAPRVTRLSGEARNRIVAATSSTFGQASKSAFGIALRLAARVHDRGRHRIDQNAVLGDFLRQRHGERGDARLGDRVGRHAGAAAPFQRRPRRDIDDAAAAFMAFTAARQHRKHDTRLLSICAISAALSVSATLPMAKPPAMWIEAHERSPARLSRPRPRRRDRSPRA